MIQHVPSLEKLTHELAKLPGIGPKTAQRLAYYVLRSSQEYVDALRQALQMVKDNIHECPECYSYTEEDELCRFCQDPLRETGVLVVVEDPADISRIENSGVFKGRYHVLHGAISPLDGIAPQDLKIPQLLQKIQGGLEGTRPKITEVILALDADLEGDTTVLYLAKALREKGLQVSRIAHGVPIGGDIDYIDHRTLGRALENRVVL
jgi:recombination protein RecR